MLEAKRRFRLFERESQALQSLDFSACLLHPVRQPNRWRRGVRFPFGGSLALPKRRKTGDSDPFGELGKRMNALA